MNIKICQSINEIDATQWNALIEDKNPFTSHEFLKALEDNACVGERFGWLPHHIAISDEKKTLIAAVPLYEKHNSYGEFVFDNAWAEAYQRHGFQYFPKLVSSIPYTPAQGQRFLCLPKNREQVYPLILSTIQELAKQIKASGFHCLFPTRQEQQWFEKNALFSRHDCQFHWHNENKQKMTSYQSFEEFLSTFTSRKRKNIRKERQAVENANISFRVLDGYSASINDWKTFSQLYLKTFNEKWGTATLNEDFFIQVAKELPKQVVLVLADNEEGICIAGSLMYRSETTLYGRFWGCFEEVDHLHFETCYYQGIDYCIKHKLQKFEPGAQGEHKVARGFVPTLTQSSHFLTAPHFQEAIKNFVIQEKQHVEDYIDHINQHLPYKTNQ